MATTESGPHAYAGHVKHHFLEELNCGVSREVALRNIEDKQLREQCAAINLDGLPIGPGWEAEPAFVYDVESGAVRLLGHRINRRYGDLADSEIPASLDVVRLDLAGLRAEVYDYKTGFQAEGNTPRAKDNPQLKFGALCVSRYYHVHKVHVGIFHIHDDGSWTIDPADFDDFDLDLFALELKNLYAKIRNIAAKIDSGQTPDVHQGSWCKYCPSQPHCPAVVGIVRAAAMSPVATQDEILAMLTPETASAAYSRLRAVENAIKTVKGALRQFSLNQPIEVAPGTYYGPKPVNEDEIDLQVAIDTLTDTFGPGVGDRLVTGTTTKAAIKRAITPYLEHVRATGLEVTEKSAMDTALKAIRARGGIVTKQNFDVKEYKAK